MNYYQHVNFNYGEEQRQAILDMLPEIISENPEFAKFVFNCSKKHIRQIGSILNLKYIDGILYFRMPATFRSQIHIDMNLSNNQVRTCALNLPLTPCKDVVMKWYNKADGAKEETILGAHLTSFPVLDWEDSILHTTGELNRPMLAQIHPWHNVENLSNQEFDERFISIRFARGLSESHILQIINDIR